MGTPFQQHRGVTQQRAQLAQAVDGTYVYELGSSFFADVRLAVGDRHQVQQTFTKSAQSYFVRARARVRTPDNWQGAEAFVLVVLLDGVARYTRPITQTDGYVDVQDIAISMVSAAPGAHTIAFRLERTA